MIDITKKYKTRDGQEVTNLLRLSEPLASGTPYPIFGLVAGNLFTWRDDGYSYEGVEDDLDLIEEKQIVKLGIVFSKDYKKDYGLWRILPVELAAAYKQSEYFKVIEIEAPEFE
jgi:hypothetical protein